jgi:hypothetical protein
MRRKILKNPTRIEQATSASLRVGPAKRPCEKKITTAFLSPYRECVLPLRVKFAESLAQLEAENLDLRHRAVDLALQIQALGERTAQVIGR